ncbi:ABC transporter permease [Alkaliphilus pronyensis]|nr:ABC transporter permease [Alkaliphilus pronyensis]
MNSILIAINFIKRVLKEKSTLLYFLVFPILAGILASSMTQQKEIEVGVLNKIIGDGLIQVLQQDNQYKIIELPDISVEEAIKSKVVQFAIDIKSLDTTNPNGIKIYALKDSQDLQTFKGKVENYIVNGGVVEATEEAQSNTFGEGRIVIGFLSMFVLMFMASTIALFLEDKRGKTLMRMFSAPLSEYDITMGTLLGSVAIGTVQILMFLLLTCTILNINYQAFIGSIFIIMIFFLIAATALALALASFISDIEKYNAISTLVVVPTCLVGGSFFPIAFMPKKLQNIAQFLPQKWLMEAYDKLVMGIGIEGIFNDLAILVLFGIVFFTFGLKVLKPSVDEL